MSPQKISVLLSIAALFYISSVPIAFGQLSDDEPHQETSPSSKVPNQAQGYHGVTPGAGNNLPKVALLRNKKGTWVTWPGFSMTDNGGSQVFLQTTGPIQHTLISKGKRIEIKIKRAKVFLSNNRNPLVTTHFNTPLKRAYIKKKGRGLALVLELKEQTTPTLSQAKDRDGYHYLFVDFSPGQYETSEKAANGIKITPARGDGEGDN